MRKIIFLFLIGTALTGCKDKVADVKYYLTHPEEARVVIDKCITGEITDDNCKNARLALTGIDKSARQ